MENICPICGSQKIHKIKIERELTGGFNTSKNITLSAYECEDCGFSGDIFNENKEALRKAKEELQSEVMIDTLEYFSNQNINFAGIERILDLPQRTLTKWKNQNTKPSASATVLFKYLRIFPWMLKVAENGFNIEIAQKIHLETAFHQIISCLPTEKLVGYDCFENTKTKHHLLHFVAESSTDFSRTSPMEADSSTSTWDSVALLFVNGE